MAEDPRDEETRQHDVPPAGYEDEQATAEGSAPPPPPPPPPGYDEQPTEVGRDAYVNDDPETGETITDEHDAVPYEEETTEAEEPEPALSTQDQRAQATQGSVKSEPAPPGGDADDEYRWHTDRTARSAGRAAPRPDRSW